MTATGKILKRSLNRGTIPETIIYNTKKSAGYTIKVFGYNGAFNAATCYSLKVTLSGTNFKGAGIEEEEVPVYTSPLVIYPNPVSGRVNILCDAGASGPVVIRILNITGQEVIRVNRNAAEGQNKFTIDISTLRPGIYFAELTGNGDRLFGRFIVE